MRKKKRWIGLLFLLLLFAALPATVRADNSRAPDKVKKVVMKKPGMIQIKGTGKDKSNEVGITPKKKSSLTRGRACKLSKNNKYTAEFAVPKGTYYVTGFKKKGKYNFKVTTSYFSTLKNGQKISWKRKIPFDTALMSDRNNLFYRIKPNKSGYISFDELKGSVNFVFLYDKNMKAVSNSSDMAGQGNYFAVEKNKEYYVGIVPWYGASSYKIQYRLTKASNQAGKSKSKAVELGTKKRSWLPYAKGKNTGWFKYKVPEKMTHYTYIRFNVKEKVSMGNFNINVYKGAKQIYGEEPYFARSRKLFYGGAKIRASDVRAGDVLYIKLTSNKIFGDFDPITGEIINSWGTGYCQIWAEGES